MAEHEAEDNIVRFTHVRFGDQTVSSDKIIVFSDGIPGFESFKNYALFDDPDILRKEEKLIATIGTIACGKCEACSLGDERFCCNPKQVGKEET